MVVSPPSVEIRLLGDPYVVVDGKRISFRTARTAALLAYLVVQGRPVPRAVLAEALWPDRESESAYHNLRQTLLRLRQVLGPAEAQVIWADRRVIRIRMDAIWCDVPAFREYLSQGTCFSLRTAADLYAGQFLAGFEDEWALPVRADLSQALVRGLVESASRVLHDAPDQALQLALRAIAEEPFHEGARARKIAALRIMGEETLALREFEAYETLLADELGLRPSRIVEEALSGVPRALLAKAEPPRVELNAVLQTLAQSEHPEDALRLAISAMPYWIETGRSEAGLRQLDQVRQLYNKAPPVELCIPLALVAATLAMNAGDTDRGMAEAMAVREAGNDVERTSALCLLAKALLRRQARRDARRQALRSVRLGRGLSPTPLSVSEAWLVVSMVHLHEGSPLRARNAAARALASGGDSPRTLARAGLFLAFAFSALNSPHEARNALDIAVSRIENDRNAPSADIRMNAARLLDELGEYDRAATGYESAIAELRGYESAWSLAIGLTYLADLKEFLGDPLGAIPLHEEACEIRAGKGDRIGEATSLRGLGRAHLRLRSFEAARTVLRESVRLYSETEAIPGVASSLIPLARAEAALGSEAIARRLLVRAIGLLRGMTPTVRANIGPQSELLLPEAERLLRRLA